MQNNAFLDVPGHVYSEIIKLNGVDIKSKPLVLEEAKTKQNIVHQINKTYHIINLQIIT